MLQVKNAIKDAIPMDSYRSWFIQDRIGFVEYAETSRGFLVVIAPNNFFRDKIREKFLMQILEAVKPLGFKYVEIIKIGDQLPTFQPKELDPEEWDNIQRQIHTMRVVRGLHKSVEAKKAEVTGYKPTPNYIYRHMDGLDLRQTVILPEEEIPQSDGSLEQEGCIYTIYIANQARGEI